MEYRLTEKEFEYVQAFKRDLHMHPETAHHEFRTTEKIKEALSSLPGIDILDTGFRTGLIAVIRGREEGKKILLRADIDAIVQNEEYESPWKSQTPGVMHACGHDLHTSSLIGAAVILSKIKAAGELKNTVYLLFQPAEEGTTGARMVLYSGVLDEIKPDMCFGFHNWPKLRSGTVACHKGVLMSGKRNFTINIKGSGGHGSMPHLNIDPIVCSAAVIQSLQTVVSRNMDPLDSAVLAISMIEVMMTATIRSLSDKALDRAIERVESITMNTAHAYECEAEIDWKERIPSVFNTDEMYEVALRAAEETGAEITDAEPSLASEDFALYRTVAPSFFYWIGSTPEGEEPEDLHRPRFHTDDSIMKTAAELFVRAAMTE